MKRKYRGALVLALLALLAWAVWPFLKSSANAREEQTISGGSGTATAAGGRPAGSFVASTGEGQGAPRIFFPKAEHDFGKVQRGAKLAHVFKVRNTGDGPLRLISAKGS